MNAVLRVKKRRKLAALLPAALTLALLAFPSLAAAGAARGLKLCGTLVPAFFLVLSSIAIYKYPITRDAYYRIRQQLLMKD